MDKKKPIGYTAEQTKSMKKLIERTEPKSGDYVGSGTVTEVPKKKKKMKRMMDGGRVVMGVPVDPSTRGKLRRKVGQAGGMAGRPATPVRTAGGLGTIGGAMPSRTAGGLGMVSPAAQAQGAQNVINRMNAERAAGLNPNPRMMRGGGLARKGVGQALAAGGAVRACGVAKRGKTKGKMV